MVSFLRARWLGWVLAGCAIFFLYFFGLARTGLLGPDEPRYAAIGREMARSGDWITPRLWGSPWFEKPALLYWMTATGFKLGLDPDLAPRLPVAVMSVAFLLFFWWVLQREYDREVAWFAAAILGTSVGWLAFSHVGVTDLPLSACLSVAMLLVLRTKLSDTLVAGLFLGLAVLAKGIVPFALFLPAIWYLRRQPGRVVLLLATALAVAAPWYLLVTARFGSAFWLEFFVKHHVERLLTSSLQHVQPWWYFGPVLLAGLFPWTPLLPLAFRRDVYLGSREWFLAGWAVLVVLLFSASRNKLPGYILPMLPPLAVLMALGLRNSRSARYFLAATAALLAVIPAIAGGLPQALLTGVRHAAFRFGFGLPVLALFFCGLAWWSCKLRGRSYGVATVVGLVTVLIAQVVWQVYPALDTVYSARGFWRERALTGTSATVCVAPEDRVRRYGLDYYAEKLVPDCNE